MSAVRNHVQNTAPSKHIGAIVTSFSRLHPMCHFRHTYFITGGSVYAPTLQTGKDTAPRQPSRPAPAQVPPAALPLAAPPAPCLSAARIAASMLELVAVALQSPLHPHAADLLLEIAVLDRLSHGLAIHILSWTC